MPDTSNEAMAELVRVLAASKPGGTFLSLGMDAGEVGAKILDGMDLSSRLVIVVVDSEADSELKGKFDHDLRVTVHKQDALEFLDDVRDHRFDLIADLGSENCAGLLERGLPALTNGGFYVTRCTSEAVSRAVADFDQVIEAQVPCDTGVTLIARGTERPKPKRRGGRRSKQGVTPLFSAKTRRRDG